MTPTELANYLDEFSRDAMLRADDRHAVKSAATALRRLGRVDAAAELWDEECSENCRLFKDHRGEPCRCGVEALREALRSGG